ncbi:Harbinger transposase-derived protein [Arabidopsis suecica]|uniref:Harbinger transposase-derived protein n=1 Tax=Arabidopsis suecica TaxID=45249 RepID=A0A8T2BSL0_ARASU|nr:Harbinger transposase-derived protein [Arabidopsis suecica]
MHLHRHAVPEEISNEKAIILRIVESLSNYVYFTQRRNNSGKPGLSPVEKCTAALRMLAYGCPADACDEYVKIGESTALECTKKFCEGIITLFQDEYLRRPNVTDLERLLQVGQDRGFPGMIVILEAVASYDLWIWHAFFGLPGTLNDINVLDRSPVFDDIISGEAPEVNFIVNGQQYNMAYYLADGIYAKWPVFVQSIQVPVGDKAQLFAKQQESCRKDVE